MAAPAMNVAIMSILYPSLWNILLYKLQINENKWSCKNH